MERNEKKCGKIRRHENMKGKGKEMTRNEKILEKKKNENS